MADCNTSFDPVPDGTSFPILRQPLAALGPWQSVDPPELWLDFSVDGMPFQVREQRVNGGGWQVDLFQSHAG